MKAKQLMKSMFSNAKKKAGLEDQSGVMGLDTAKSFVVALLGLAVIGITFLIVMNSLGDTSIVQDDNDTTNVIDNVSSGASDFFSNAGTWFSLLAVVIIILIISAVIFVVNRFGGQNQGASM